MNQTTMESLIGVFNTHRDAIRSIESLKEGGFTSKNLSVLTKANADDDLDEEVRHANTAAVGLGVGAVAGTTLGVLAGVGILAIPGLGFLVGAGAVAGAVAGFDFGVIGGGLLSALAIGGIEKDVESKYQSELESGKSLVIVQGSEEELSRARSILEKEGLSVEVNTY